ncbi:unnamed protein product, partial [Rotaria magnacalcarata]
ISSKNTRQAAAETSITVSLRPLSNGLDTKAISKHISESQSQTDTRSSILSESTANGEERKASVPAASKTKIQIRKQQQEKQLTIMLVWISTLYLCGQIPMLFAYPNFVFKETNKPAYKYYALVVNLLELITYLANFCIYIKFTTQFRQVFRAKVKQLFFCFFKTT